MTPAQTPKKSLEQNEGEQAISMNDRTNFTKVDAAEMNEQSVKSSAQAVSEAFIKTPKMQNFIS